MSGMDDERVRFYLKHRQQIETWAALRKEASAAVDAWLRTLVDDVEQLAGDLGTDVRALPPEDEGDWPFFGLVRETWSAGGARPWIKVGLQWVRKDVLLREGQVPYVGVSTYVGEDHGVKLRAAFRKHADPTRRARGDRTTPWWPALREVPCDFDYWDKRDAARDTLLAALREAFEVYSPLVDQAVATVGAQRPEAD